MLIVTGVILANASLDIALHDTFNMLFYDFLIVNINNSFILPILPNNKHSTQKLNSKTYIEQFWVGLMDGDGSIQVNHQRSKILQFRLVIKLKNTIYNENMLNLIAENIGGSVRIVNEDKFVIWVVNNKQKIQKIIQIFTKYPPMTSRLRAQLRFLLECLDRNDISWYLNSRNNKYLNSETKVLTDTTYYREWLSGFIEAESCFSIRENGNHSFSIGQNNDKYLIEFIKIYFKINAQIRQPNSPKLFWSIETYSRSTLLNVINHCDNYPLIGQNLQSLLIFKNHLNIK